MGNKTNKMSSDSAIKLQIINALEEGDINQLESLFEGDPNLLTASLADLGNTALHLAVRNEGMKNKKHGPKVVEFLLEKGADVNAKNRAGQTPLHLAVTYCPELIKLLLEKGADVNARDISGSIALFARNADLEIVQLMLNYGLNVNNIDKRGETPLNQAINYNNIELAELLLQHGADTRPVCVGSTRSLEMDELLLRYPEDNHRINEQRLDAFARSHKLWELWKLENGSNAEGENQQQQGAAANPYEFFSYTQWLPRETLEDTLALIGPHIKKPSSP